MHPFYTKLRNVDLKNLKSAKQSLLKSQEAGFLPIAYSMPIGIQLELTAACNLYCKHCYNASGKGCVPDKMTSRHWITLANEIVTAGGAFQVIISGGEPLLLGDDLFRIMNVFSEDGSAFILISNGFLLDGKCVKQLQNYQYHWVQISLDSISEDRHDEFRGRKGSWQRATQAAMMIADAGIPLKIAHSATPAEIKHLEEFVEFCILLGASSVIIGDIMPSGRSFLDSTLVMSPEQKEIFLSSVSTLEKKYKDRIMIQVSSLIKSQLELSALGPLESVIIRPNGDVRLDCVSPFVIGNVLEKTFTEIWRQTPAYIWQSQPIQEYINSVNEAGYSTILNNYQDGDIRLY